MSELSDKLAELANEYTLNSFGTITNQGKFEGETLAAPYYYDCFLNGGDVIFEITDEEREAFGFSLDDNFAYLEETNEGFVYVCLFMTEDQAEDYQRDCEYAEDDWL